MLEIEKLLKISKLSGHFKYAHAYMRIGCYAPADTVYETLKTQTKYAHIVRGRPTLEHWNMSSVFGAGRSVNLMRYLFMSEHL